MPQVLRVESIEVGKNDKLSKVCHQAKNLYNRANFLLKQSLNKHNKLLFYYDLNKLLKEEECYKVLPAHTAQQTLKLLSRNWKGYFQAMKEWKANPSLFFSCPCPPGYKARDGEMVAIFSNQQARIVNGWIVLAKKKVGYSYKTRLTARTKLREVRVIPRRVGYTLELVYLKSIPEPKRRGTKKGAIDLGLVNLVTFVDNLGNQPIVIKDHGKGIKSITQYYLKKQTQVRLHYINQQRKKLKGNKTKVKYGTSFYQLREKWRKKLRDAVHKLTHYLVELWVERGLEEVVIGYNELWKQGMHFLKKTTQLFVTLPFLKIIRLLQSKAAERGIVVETIPENHTSTCSFLDNEFPQHHAHYTGR
ncbi:MAG: RNA-guided endonuclease InsQ/TnpB family protein [Candidatus Heimdallarchaeaceae archaeon]